jgi:hypothetical protein
MSEMLTIKIQGLTHDDNSRLLSIHKEWVDNIAQNPIRLIDLAEQSWSDMLKPSVLIELWTQVEASIAAAKERATTLNASLAQQTGVRLRALRSQCDALSEKTPPDHTTLSSVSWMEIIPDESCPFKYAVISKSLNYFRGKRTFHETPAADCGIYDQDDGTKILGAKTDSDLVTSMATEQPNPSNPAKPFKSVLHTYTFTVIDFVKFPSGQCGARGYSKNWQKSQSEDITTEMYSVTAIDSRGYTYPIVCSDEDCSLKKLKALPIPELDSDPMEQPCPSELLDQS